MRTRYVLLDHNAQPVGLPASLGPEQFGAFFACTFSNPGCNRPDVEWNSATNEFGVIFQQLAGNDSLHLIRLARVRADGGIAGTTTIGETDYRSARKHGLGVNPETSSYIVAWVAWIESGGTVTPEFRAAEVGGSGTVLASGVLESSRDSAVFAGFSDPLRLMALARLPLSGTFVVIAPATNTSILVAELNQHGALLHGFRALTPSGGGAGHAPRVAAGSAGWLGVFPGAAAVHEFWAIDGHRGINAHAIGTSSRGGGSAWRIGGCLGPDPFAVLGGGTCHNGGWLPPGIPVPGAPAPPPPPPPSPSPGTCATPDPFVALGGGRCVNGGWLPPGMF